MTQRRCAGLLQCAVMAAVLAVGGCSGGKPGSGAKPEVALTAAELIAEYQKDKDAAALKYDGKIIEVSGPVRGMALSFASAAEPNRKGELTLCLVLGAPGSPVENRVMCLLTADAPPWGKVAPPRKVKVKGQVVAEAIFGPPVIGGCTIVEADEGSAPTVTATEFTREFKEDASKAKEKYPVEAYIILRGEVDGASSDQAPFTGLRSFNLTLKGEGDSKIRCLGESYEQLANGLKPGQKLTLIGKFTGEGFDAALQFNECLVVEGPN